MPIRLRTLLVCQIRLAGTVPTPADFDSTRNGLLVSSCRETSALELSIPEGVQAWAKRFVATRRKMSEDPGPADGDGVWEDFGKAWAAQRC